MKNKYFPIKYSYTAVLNFFTFVGYLSLSKFRLSFASMAHQGLQISGPIGNNFCALVYLSGPWENLFRLWQYFITLNCK